MGYTTVRSTGAAHARRAERVDLSSTLKAIETPLDVDSLELTLINNHYGPGVIVSDLGSGSATQAGMLVGDVIVEVNGIKVLSHQQAFQVMRREVEKFSR